MSSTGQPERSVHLKQLAEIAGNCLTEEYLAHIFDQRGGSMQVLCLCQRNSLNAHDSSMHNLQVLILSVCIVQRCRDGADVVSRQLHAG